MFWVSGWVKLQLSELWLQIYLYVFVYTRLWSLLQLLFEHWKLAIPSWCVFESLTLCSQCIMVNFFFYGLFINLENWITCTRLCLYSHVTSWQALSILLIAIFINSKWEPKKLREILIYKNGQTKGCTRVFKAHWVQICPHFCVSCAPPSGGFCHSLSNLITVFAGTVFYKTFG